MIAAFGLKSSTWLAQKIKSQSFTAADLAQKKLLHAVQYFNRPDYSSNASTGSTHAKGQSVVSYAISAF